MKMIKVIKTKAEQVRRQIEIDPKIKAYKKGDYVYFAFIGKLPKNLEKDVEIVDIDDKLIKHKTKTFSLKEYLNNKGINIQFSAFENVGDIAIIEMHDEIKEYEMQIAEGIMKTHHKIKTVLKKTSGMQGVMRIRTFEHIAGKDKRVTEYKENGCTYKIDVAKMFYSSKLSTERLRISKLIKDGENVLVPFAGYGPFAILFAKQHPKSNVIGIELNKDAVNYFEQNIKLNKIENIEIVQGDARKIVKQYENWADRIVMPLPKDAVDFVKDMMPALKNKGVIHLYAFTSKDEPYKELEQQLIKIAKGYNIKFILEKIVRPYSPSTVEIVMDIKCEKQHNIEDVNNIK